MDTLGQALALVIGLKEKRHTTFLCLPSFHIKHRFVQLSHIFCNYNKKK
uniref:Uncharacterized protein n=1 Tax=Anguilla anguilla TaxID=7936 RepID=A0A0E9X8Y1_ANGAN